jgi:hypothetical protein
MIPKIAKDKKAIANILEKVSKLPTKHSVFSVLADYPLPLPDKKINAENEKGNNKKSKR